MYYHIAEAFQDARATAQSLFGNPYVVFSGDGTLLPRSFTGVKKDDAFSNFINRRITTDNDVSFLQLNFYVANAAETGVRMRIWKLQDRFVAGVRTATDVYTTTVEPTARLVLTNNGFFAV